MTGRRWLWALAFCCAVGVAPAQQTIDPVRSSATVFIRPYLAPEVPAVRLANSDRMHVLLRGGNLYLTVQDMLALVLENNIEIEVVRYNPILSAWQVERTQAGGALPGVPSGAAQAGSVASGQGVVGSQNSVGVNLSGSNGSASNTANATISQIGPVTQTLDPSIQEASTFSHKTAPQFDIVQSITPVLISNTRVYTGSYQQGFLIGGSITATYSEHYLNENAPTDFLNPSVAPNLSIGFQQNLLRGFGIAVNARTITVAKLNLKMSPLNFKSQVIGVVAQALNLYYGLVAASEDVKAKQRALELAQTLYEDNKRQAEIGTLTPLDVTMAEGQRASAERDLVDSESSLQQQELQLKNLISRMGLADPALAAAHVVAIDQIVISAQDDLPPLPDLIQKALANRSDLAAEKVSEQASEISALGTKNGVLPTAAAIGGYSNSGLAGVPKTVLVNGRLETADPYFAGGMGNALGQIFRNNFPTERIGAFAVAQVHNRQAQADQAIDQLQLRQTQIENQKDANQVGVDVLNSVTALRQARVRYAAAVENRILDEQLLEAEQKKYSLGASIPYNIIQQQRELATAQSAVTSALVSYSNARVALDQTLGTILEANHISIDEALSGKVSRVSSAPAENSQR